MKAIVFVDGSGGSPKGSSSAAVLIDPKTGNIIDERMQVIEPKCSNNIAEYWGVILGISTALEHEVDELEIFCDSQLIVNQINGKYKVKKKELAPLRDYAWRLAGEFDSVEIHWVRRDKNKRADALCRIALGMKTPLRKAQQKTKVRSISATPPQ